MGFLVMLLAASDTSRMCFHRHRTFIIQINYKYFIVNLPDAVDLYRTSQSSTLHGLLRNRLIAI
ncbi:hypothetical protein DVJ77_06235 [Dyella tabacisoli]|uniref:Uncharacterized protein n=1 Tax=Dyella tabacisoli TaxID=2282381 RepID=A0A369UW06_9GAMM|nr:hypothetical protein DVJ77_06235 [Dyella tabacisoli]